MSVHKSNSLLFENEKRCLKYLCANNADQMRGLLSCAEGSAGSVHPLSHPQPSPVLYMLFQRLRETRQIERNQTYTMQHPLRDSNCHVLICAKSTQIQPDRSDHFVCLSAVA